MANAGKGMHALDVDKMAWNLKVLHATIPIQHDYVFKANAQIVFVMINHRAHIVTESKSLDRNSICSKNLINIFKDI